MNFYLFYTVKRALFSGIAGTNPGASTFTETDTIAAFVGALEAPVKDGYSFKNWALDAEGANVVDTKSSALMSTLDTDNDKAVTLYAIYELNPVTPPLTTLYGDAYKDGVVDGSDATIILQYLAEMDVDIDLTAADAYYDGVVDGSDATIILQYLAEMDVTMGPISK